MSEPTLLRRVRERLARAGLLTTKRWVQRYQARTIERLPRRTLLVAGVQRSGTNMVMDLLERSYQTEVFHERDPRAFDNYQLRDDTIIHQLVNGARAEVVVIKCLMESQRLADLLNRFAPSTALWIFRNYHDVVNSMLQSFGNQAGQIARIARANDGDEWLSENMSDATHLVVRQIAATPLDNPSAAALQWYIRNMCFFEQGLDTDVRVQLVDYDRLVTSPDKEFARIYKFINIKFSTRIMRAVSAGSIGKRKPPQIRADVAVLCDEMQGRLRQAVGD